MRDVTEKLKGPRGALGILLGNEADAKKLITALDRTNALLARVDGLVAKVDAQALGPDGLVPEARAAIVQLNAPLADARELEEGRRHPRGRAGRCRQRARGDRGSRRLARRGRYEPAQSEPHDRRGQSALAIRARPEGSCHETRTARDAVIDVLLRRAIDRSMRQRSAGSRLESNAKTSMDHAVAAYLAGDTRLADSDFERARSEIARTGRIDLLGRAELVRCAARVASLVFEPCEGFEKLRADAPAAERAYADYLAARVQPQDIALLPAATARIAATNLVRRPPMQRCAALRIHCRGWWRSACCFKRGVRTDGYRRCRGDCVRTGMAASTVGVAERAARACRQGSGCERKRAATQADRRGTRRQVEQLSGKCIDVEFKDRTALITGAAGSLVASLRMYSPNAEPIWCWSVAMSRRLKVFEPHKQRHLLAPTDLLDQAQVDATVRKALDRFKRIDVLVNLAGGFRMGEPVHATSDANWDFCSTSMCAR